MEDSIMEEFKNNNDPMERTFINYVIQSGYGIKYIYWSEKTADTVIFPISSYMLKTVIENWLICFSLWFLGINY